MRNRLGSLLAATLGTLTLTLTPSAFAQDEGPEDAASTPDTDATSEDDAAGPLTTDAEDDAAPPPSDAAAGQAKVGSEGSASQSGSAEVSLGGAAAGTDAEGKASPEATADEEGPHVTLEVVPRSGYPSWQVRGIPGGSLAATMHGMQWPYLPAEGDHDTVRVGVSGSMWNDLSYVRILSGLEDSYPNQKRLAAQTRAVLRISPTYSTPDGWFAQGQWEAVGHGDLLVQNSNLASTDDLYVRIGKWKLFDITAGRFRGWEISNHYGMALDLNTLERNGAAIEQQPSKPVPAYGLTYFWDYKDGRLGHYAAHLYPADWLRFELLTELGTGTEGILRQTNFRPSGIVDLGFLKVKGGLEYGVALPQGDDEQRRIYKNGFGVALQGVFAPWIEGGISFARGYEDLIDIQGTKDLHGSNTVTGYGAFLNARPFDKFVIGLGVLRSEWENLFRTAAPGEHYGDYDTNEQQQEFIAVQYSIWNQFTVKLVGAHAKFDFYESSSTPFTNELYGLRLRTAVAF